MIKKLDDVGELKELLESKKLVIGAETVLKKLKTNELKKVFVSSNAPQNLLDDLNKYCKITKFELNSLKQTNEELGVILKKQFMISVIGVVKTGDS